MQTYLKAIYGAIGASIASTGAAYIQGNGHIGWQAGIMIAGAFWGALGVIWAVPNTPPVRARRERKAVSTDPSKGAPK